MLTRHRLINLLLVFYLLVIVGLMLLKNVSLTPDRLFVILLFAAVIVGRTKVFLKDWVPFIGLLLAYELVRGFADQAGAAVNVANMIEFERKLLGFIPTVELQARFFNPNQIAPWDIAAVIIDFLHFPLPLLVAFYLWVKDKHQYWKFIVALLSLSFAGFLTYLVFPAAPPWYAAAKEGLIPVYKIVDIVVGSIGWGWNLSQIYNNLNPNPVAAMPSLHSAFPWLCFLVLHQYNKKMGWWFLPYPILVWISIVYLGEHYVIDIIGGVFYATTVYLVVYHQKRIRRWFKNNLMFNQNKKLKTASEVEINEG